MKRMSLLLASAALVTLPISAASADCREEIALLGGSDVTASIGSADTAASGTADGKTTNFETGAGLDTGPAEVSKDGSMAPLESEADASTDMETSGATGAQATTSTGSGQSGTSDTQTAGEVSKDGSAMPMDSGSDTAMSGQDGQAQQDGAQTAASAAADSGDTSASSSMTADASQDDSPLARAELALAAGDEEACMAAIEEAKAAKTQ